MHPIVDDYATPSAAPQVANKLFRNLPVRSPTKYHEGGPLFRYNPARPNGPRKRCTDGKNAIGNPVRMRLLHREQELRAMWQYYHETSDSLSGCFGGR